MQYKPQFLDLSSTILKYSILSADRRTDDCWILARLSRRNCIVSLALLDMSVDQVMTISGRALMCSNKDE